MTVAVAMPSNIPADRIFEIDIYRPEGGRSDFHGAWKAIQDASDACLIWTPLNGGHWIATRYHLLQEIYGDHVRFSSRIRRVPKVETDELSMLPVSLDPPRHRPYRSLLNDGLSPKAVMAMTQTIRGLTIDLIESFQAKGECEFVKDFAEILPIQVFLQMVDLPLADMPMLRGWVDQMVRPSPGGPSFEDGAAKLQNYLAPWIDARRAAPAGDMLSRIVSGTVDGRPISRQEAIQMATLVLFGGLDTVASMLKFVMLFLACNPAHRAELVSDPGLIAPAVEELLRRYAMVINAREVLCDTIVDGVELKRGDMIVLPSQLGGLDEQINQSAMDVDFHRASAHHLTFGNGSHKCPGAHLGRTELRIVIEEWLRHIPEFALKPGSEISFIPGIAGTVASLPLCWTPMHA